MDTYSNALLHVGEEDELVNEAVADCNLGESVQSVETVAAAISLLEETPVAGVVAEMDLPDGSGLDILDASIDGLASVPIIIVTGERSDRADAVAAGAADVYVRNDGDAEPAVLGQRLTNVLAHRQILSEDAGMRSETTLLLDSEGRIVTATVGTGSVVEAETPTDFVGNPLSSLVAEEDVRRIEECFERILDGDLDRETLTVSFRQHSGTLVPAEIRFRAIPGGGANRVVCATIADVLHKSDAEQHSTPLIDLLLDTIDDVFYLLDTDGNLIRWNDHLSAVTGYTDKEIDEMGPLEFFAADDRERVATTISEILETGSSSVEAEMRTKDGEQIPFDYTGAALTDAEGTTRGIVGIGRDISERKRRERELRRYETIINVLADPVYALDADGRYNYVNDAFLEHTGYDRSELVGSHVSKVLPDAEIERGRTVIRELLDDENKQSTTWEMTRITADGTEIPTENHTALLPFDEGQFQGSVGVIRDISERKQRKRELQRERDRLKSVFDAAPYPFVHVSFEDGDPIPLRINDAFENKFGVAAKEVVGSSIDPHLVPESEQSEAREMNKKMRAGEPVTREVTRLAADGSEREFLFKSETVSNEDGSVEWLGAYIDITERKRRIELLEQLRQNITDVVWMTDPEKNTMEFVSNAYEEVWGRSTESLRAEPQSFVEAIHPADRDRVERALETQQTDPQQYEETYRVERPDGEIRWVHDRASGVFEDGELRRIIGIATDITERRERERELRLKNRAMDEAPIGITIHELTDSGFPITYANSGFEQLTGHEPTAIEGGQLSMLAGAETADSQLSELREAFEEERSASLVALLYRADGDPFWGRISLAPVAGEDGSTTHFVGFLQDVTTIKEHEQEVARRLEEFGELLAEDLRIPVQQAQSEIGSADLEAAERSLERVEDLIDDLVTVHTRSVTSREVGDRLNGTLDGIGVSDDE
ncbi:PAS domain S-box protein [Halovenus sp. HT40]|uniref:PAS domain S-box protein n=1 Tax=Halovenus sp. HT40 TaxID=3126691 RepID=UPI00300EFD20